MSLLVTEMQSTKQPSCVPRRSSVLTLLVFLVVLVNSMTLGYDGNMMNSLMILPSFSDYMHFTTATQSLSSSIIWIGGAAIAPFGGPFVDKFGRKNGMLGAAVISFIGIALQGSSQNAAMFMVARFILGMGVGFGSIACPTYASEVAPTKYRAFLLGFYYDIWYFGGMIAALITYKTAELQSAWSWRLPSLLQAIPSILSVALLPFVPETPRWLVAQGKNEEALQALAIIIADGDVTNTEVNMTYSQIVGTIAYERENPASHGWLAAVKTPSNRRRTTLAISVALIGNLSGSAIASYWLGTMLSQAGISDTYSQLQINIALNVWCLACAGTGTLIADRVGRKMLAIGSLLFALVSLYLVGALTKCECGYSFGWTTLLVMYPPEVLNFSLRANGMAIYTFMSNSASVFATFIMPFALNSIGWKTYMINASWDVLEVIFVALFWVETSKRSLEEIDELFEGEIHSSNDNFVRQYVLREA
ncbi:MFS sugar transporter-like protein [Talaromyces proteolyticus]|uniref:MFS sugar transporter-like protein n=1 Tax=Talaromyces proteolyticus TaxID=1131652 RepID=A0AAD4KDS9_9EURO|nr:MFS sugar transporter-like protein [Talaromyces proteolyticus]KAH8689437.1 MFS sugar transporter-like protein [Talaromyces proteolyticus]